MNWLNKPLFKRPKWLKPELEIPMYYVHLVILAVVVLGLLQYFYGGEMFTVRNVLVSIPFLIVGDAVAHTLTGLD